MGVLSSWVTVAPISYVVRLEHFWVVLRVFFGSILQGMTGFGKSPLVRAVSLVEIH